MGTANNRVALYGLDPKAGQIHYFRVRLPRAAGSSFSLVLEPVNIDEDRLLLAQYAHAESTAKK